MTNTNCELVLEEPGNEFVSTVNDKSVKLNGEVGLVTGQVGSVSDVRTNHPDLNLL